MNILVTGANGFIGQHFLRFIGEHSPQDKIFAISRSRMRWDKVETVVSDLTDEAQLTLHLKNIAPDRIYHFAGISRVSDMIQFPEYFSYNFLTTIALLNALGPLKSPTSLFFASSVHVYGNKTGLVSESAEAGPVNNYGFTKYLAEQALKNYIVKFPHLRVVVGRLFSCIGPEQPEGFVTSDLCRRILHWKSGPLSVGPLEVYRRFLDVRDAVQIFPKLLEAPGNALEIYNIASPHEFQVGDVLKILLSIAKKNPQVETSKAFATNKFKGIDLDLKKLEKTLPDLSFRPIEQTLKDIYEWNRANA